MTRPNFNEEKILWQKGFKFVAGLDEAGRGPLAGPVVAAGVLLNLNVKKLLKGINDSLIIDDTYNSSPFACESALKTLAEIKSRKVKLTWSR